MSRGWLPFLRRTRKRLVTGSYGHVLRRLFHPLSLFQVATLLALTGAVINTALWLWHQTDDYFLPWSSYLLSVKIAIPPLALFVGSYVVAFLTGISVADVPKTILSFLRNKFFQSYLWMSGAITIFIGATTYSVVLLSSPAPSYESFVAQVMGGEQDNLSAAERTLKEIADKNPELAGKLQLVIDVFKERADVNAGRKTLSIVRSRLLVRALDANMPSSWNDSPLRWHALAEADLLYAQSMDQALQQTALATDRKQQADLAKNLYLAAIELYQRVTLANGPLVTLLLKRSAKNNLGNVRYYLHDYPNAVNEWSEVNSAQYDGPNTSSWSNLIAGYILVGKPEEAIREGMEAKNWAESNGKAVTEAANYAGIVGNMGFAKMQAGRIDEGVADLIAANAVVEDDLSLQNLAMGYALLSRFDQAQLVLRKLRPPVQPDDEAKAIAAGQGGACEYLLWLLADPDAPPQNIAANAYAFLGEARSSGEIEQEAGTSVSRLIKRVAEYLPTAAEPCGSLSRLGPVMARLDSIVTKLGPGN